MNKKPPAHSPFARLAAAGDWDAITPYSTQLGWLAPAAPALPDPVAQPEGSSRVAAVSAAPALHPVLIEITRTHLVWVQAESRHVALCEAEKNPLVRAGAPGAAVPVDVSVEVALLGEQTAAWLDADGETYRRLHEYFAAGRAGG
jgi:hypothetical protein